jgi:hypothetical protein
MPSSSPGRVAAEKTLLLTLNGDPQFLGLIQSTGSAVNNASTTTPFNTGTLQADGFSRSLVGSLAGRVLLLQTTAAGLVLASPSPLINDQRAQTVAQQTAPVAASAAPGVALASGERVIITMLPTSGWLQWLPVSGSANLFVWELL